MNETNFPSAAQLAQLNERVKVGVNEALKSINLRIKAVELATQFAAGDPVKLAQELYDFIRKDAP